MGMVSLPSERFTRFGNPAWPGIRTANFAAREQEQAQVITSLTLQNEWLLEQAFAELAPEERYEKRLEQEKGFVLHDE